MAREMMLADQVITGRYQLGKLLGSGGFGAVYLAEDLRLHRPVAIKVCSTRRLPPEEAAESARLFEREALTLARLRHPGLTAVWDYFNQDDDWFLVMEYVPGDTLREVLARAGGPLPAPQALNYTSQLCDVLHYLHTRPEPVVFRDLKPGNIMVAPGGALKLIDFGIARLFSPGKAADTAQYATPGYAPPEQYGGQTEPRSDIYSLAAVTHQMLTGHNPATSPFALPPARAVNPALPQEIETVLLRAMALEPADRFDTVKDFCDALRAATGPAATEATVPIRTLAPPESASGVLSTPTNVASSAPLSKSGIVRGLVLLALCMILVTSVAAGAWLLRDQRGNVLETTRSLLYRRPASTPGAAAPQTSPVPAAPQASPVPAAGLRLGGAVAYVARGPNGGNDLFLRTGPTVRRLTNHAEGTSASLPAIAPDRDRIAYSVHTRTGEALWIIQADGSNPRRLLEQYTVARAPSWSPDGQRLLVEVATSEQDFRQHDIVEVELSTGVVQEVAESDGWEGGPAWSPDGKRIAFHGNVAGSRCMRLFLLDRGSEVQVPTQLTEPPDDAECTFDAGDFWPSWSPDGTWIAFERRFEDTKWVAMLNITSGELAEWETGLDPAGHPSWSPDGNFLLFEESNVKTGKTLQRLDLRSGHVEAIDPRSTGSLADWR